MTYAEYCATKCDGCAQRDKWTNKRSHTAEDCTAPTRDQFEQELQGRIESERLCLRLAADREEELCARIAELERENERLTKELEANRGSVPSR